MTRTSGVHSSCLNVPQHLLTNETQKHLKLFFSFCHLLLNINLCQIISIFRVNNFLKLLLENICYILEVLNFLLRGIHLLTFPHCTSSLSVAASICWCIYAFKSHIKKAFNDLTFGNSKKKFS